MTSSPQVGNLIIGGGVAGISAGSVVSQKTDDWVIIERGLSIPKKELTRKDLEILKANVPSSDERSGKFWLREFEKDGWYASSGASYSWGRVAMLGGRSNIWSGWSPQIPKEKLIGYVSGQVSRGEQLWEDYLNTRRLFSVKERPTSFYDRSPYSEPPISLTESSTFKKIREALEGEKIEVTLMTRPEKSKYNVVGAGVLSCETLETHLQIGTVTRISDGDQKLKTIELINQEGLRQTIRAERVFLCASAYESVRLAADAFGGIPPQQLGRNIFDHFYIKNALIFELMDKDVERYNSKLFAMPFICPIAPEQELSLQITATQAEQELGTNECLVGKINILGEVPVYSHGKICFSPTLRDHYGRLFPFFDYEYKDPLREEAKKIVSWLQGVLQSKGIKITQTNTTLSRPGESLHELGGFGIGDMIYDGRVAGLNSVFVCDGSAFSRFGAEHPNLAICAVARYIAGLAV